MKIRWALNALLMTFFGLGGSFGQAPIHQQPVVTGVAAIVNDYVITRADIERLASAQFEDLASSLRSRKISVAEFNKSYQSTFNETVDLIINRKLILSEFDRLKENSNGQIEFPEKLVDQKVKEVINDIYNGSRLDFIRTLTEQGMTLQEFKRGIREDLTVELMINQHVSNELTVSPQKILDYYNQNQEKYTSKNQIKIRLIMIFKQTAGSAAIVSEVKNKLLDGASFQEMAEVYSQGPRKESGGDYGWISVDDNLLQKEIKDVAFSLRKGEVSGILDKPQAFFIIYCEDKKEPTIAPLPTVRASIENMLLEEERNRLREQWVNKLMKSAYVKKLQATGK